VRSTSSEGPVALFTCSSSVVGPVVSSAA
jgi:hypothetical protein